MVKKKGGTRKPANSGGEKENRREETHVLSRASGEEKRPYMCRGERGCSSGGKAKKGSTQKKKKKGGKGLVQTRLNHAPASWKKRPRRDRSRFKKKY